MRRGGAWFLGLVAVAAMAAGGWFLLRPLFRRETLLIAFLRPPEGRGPSNDAMLSGAQFALEEAGRRAGRYRVQLIEPDHLDSKLPPVWIGTSEALLKYGDFQPARFRVSLMDTHPQRVDGPRRILAGYHDQGAAAARWALDSQVRRRILLRDTASPRSAAIADQFAASLPDAALESVDPLQTPAQRSDLVARLLSAGPDLLFYSGEEAPYSTTESLFTELRAKGYAGLLATGEADPEVSFLAVPCRLPEGTFLISPIGPPSAAFAARYESETGRHAGPHGWVGYLAMKSAIDVIERADSGSVEEMQAVAARRPAAAPSCALYVARNGRFEFVRDLK